MLTLMTSEAIQEENMIQMLNVAYPPTHSSERSIQLPSKQVFEHDDKHKTNERLVTDPLGDLLQDALDGFNLDEFIMPMINQSEADFAKSVKVMENERLNFEKSIQDIDSK